MDRYIDVKLSQFDIKLLIKSLEIYSLVFHNFHFLEKDLENAKHVNSSIYYLCNTLYNSLDRDYNFKVNVLQNCKFCNKSLEKQKYRIWLENHKKDKRNGYY